MDSRLPKQLLFGELVKIHPDMVQKDVRDLAVMDVRALGIKGDRYKIAQNRKQWFEQTHASNYV